MVKVVCDNCQKEQPAETVNGIWTTPKGWLRRMQDGVSMEVCSTECAKGMNTKTGKDAQIIEGTK